MKITKRPVRGLVAVTLVGAGLAITVPQAGQANAAGAPARASGLHCVVVLDKLKPGQHTSPVVSRFCGSTARTSKAYALLMTTYWDADYGGNSTQYFGRSGGCDSDGYGIPAVGYPDNTNISSFKTDNNCNYTNLWQEAFYYGKGQMYPNTYAVPYIGDTMNDNVGSIRLWHV